MNQELKTANYNELRFLSRRPFNINPKTRDERCKHVIGHPDEPPIEAPPKERPLRGYLTRDDFEDLQVAKEFLYGEYDLDRIQKELLADSQKPRSDIAGSFNPGKQVIDRMMRQCREYQTQISRVKKDVTYTELQQEVLKDVENLNIRRMHDWVDFDFADLEVETVTKLSKDREAE